MSKKYYMVLDTETAGNVPFDIAYCLIDRKGNVIERYNALTAEVFNDSTARYMLAHDQYMNAKKVKFYLKSSTPAPVRPFAVIAAHVRATIEHYNCAVVAYNAQFDYDKLNNYSVALTGKEFFPIDVQIWDMQTMALYTLCASRNYAKYCKVNGMTTPKGNCKCTAESVYSYIADNAEFEEAHTALADCEIEAQILTAVFSRKKKLHTAFCGGTIKHAPWRRYLKG